MPPVPYVKPTPDRRTLLRTALAGTAAGLSGCGTLLGGGGEPESECPGRSGEVALEPSAESTEDGAGDPDTLPDAVDLLPVVEGLESPVDVAVPPGEDLLYVATQPGELLVYGPDTACQSLLDLRDAVVVGTEQGLLGVEPHPEFGANRRLFVRYSSPSREGTPDDYSHTFVLAEFGVSEDGTRADPESERAILELPQPQENHNAGDIAFGPDGYLYVPTGDGGGHVDADPGHADDWYGRNDGGNGQDVTENLLGSILRIDVDGTGTEPYAVPPDNPLVGQRGLDEQYAWGFRNPWRLSVDGEDLFVADVGKWRKEEINLVERGGNYGWNVREGTECFNTDDPSVTRDSCPDGTPPAVRGGEPLIDPIIDYFHLDDPDRVGGVAVIGGAVYRGSRLPGLAGRYVFGDLQVKGRLFVGTPPALGDEDGWTAALLELADDAAAGLDRLLSINHGPGGELYVLGGGGVYRLAPV